MTAWDPLCGRCGRRPAWIFNVCRRCRRQIAARALPNGPAVTGGGPGVLSGQALRRTWGVR